LCLSLDIPERTLSLSTTRFLSQEISMILPGYTGSSTISVSIEPTASRSTVSLGFLYRLQLLPIFDRYGRYVCEIPVCVPTRGGFYTSNLSLQCSHATGNADITLGSDWISTSSAVFCDDGLGLEDPAQSIISSLPAGYYWSPNDGTSTIHQHCSQLTHTFYRYATPSQ
jgi:hypothetical protein